jgi:signal transduction histidine kinase
MSGDIEDRRLSDQALRASEKLARTQLETLTRTLDALAMESEPERLVAHVLCAIAQQLRALSCSIWCRDFVTDVVHFHCAFEDGRFILKSAPELANIGLTLPVEQVWPWHDVFRTGKAGVMEDIRTMPPFPWQQRLIDLGVVTILIVPMLLAGRVDSVIGVRFSALRSFTESEHELAQALANQAMLALQVTRLSARSKEAAVLAERNRFARDIHDTLAQAFTGVIVQLEAAADAAAQGLAKEAEAHVTRAKDLARQSLDDARRSVSALRPQALDQTDLCQALESLIRKMTDGTTIKAAFRVHGEPRPLPAAWEDSLLRIGQELVTNALRHARAREIRSEMTFAAGSVRLDFRDDGLGFDPAVRHDGFGLLGIRERVESMGGEWTFGADPNLTHPAD